MTTPAEIETLENELADVTAWLNANVDKLGTPEFRRAILAYALLNDLIIKGGGTPEQQAYVAMMLKKIEDGEHPDSLPKRGRER